MIKEKRDIRIRIVSNGTPEGTRLYNKNTGEEIDLSVTHIKWQCCVGKLARIELTALSGDVELSADDVDVFYTATEKPLRRPKRAITPDGS